MLKKIFFLAFILLLLTGAGLYFYLEKIYPATSPILSSQYFMQHLLTPHAKLEKHVLGFLPYWRLDDSKYIRPELLSEINYFSLTVGEDGKIVTVLDGQTDPGWRAWQTADVKNLVTKAHIMGSDVTVTIAALDNTLIETILDSTTAQQNLIDDILKQIQTRDLDGINIDFEYVGEPDLSYKEAFTTFSSNLAAALKKETPRTKLSISIMPLAARQDDLFDFPKLVPLYDRFIGMSYDYYGKSSDIAGPIAPMNGFTEGSYFFDITTTYADYLKVLPKDKIVMGIPYYGWDWAVQDGKVKNSRTYAESNANNYAGVISYARARTAPELVKKQCTWDTLAQETWCWYKDKTTGVDHQVWLADNKSVQARMNFAKKQDLTGIGIWTLGYDKDYPDLWEMLQQTFIK